MAGFPWFYLEEREETHFGSGAQNKSQMFRMIVLVFFSLALYNVLELNFIILGTFKRHSGLYFWCFLAATWGIAVYISGFFVKYYAPASLGYLAATLISIGWVGMVTGQSMVLWSRLHLVLRNQRMIKMLLYMIIFDAILCHGMIIPCVYGGFSDKPALFTKPYSIMEKIQITLFFIQEVTISTIYIWETLKLPKLEGVMRRSNRRLMHHLILVNIIIIVLDTTVIGLEYANQFEYQTAFKSFAYSAKLKLEFTILNRLVEMTTESKDASSGRRTTNTGHKSGIPLETFVSQAGGEEGGPVSYQAYAMGGQKGVLETVNHSHRDMGREHGVMMTTEVIIQREERGEGDTESFDGKSSMDSSVGRRNLDGENLSKTSSQIHLAGRGY